MYKNIEKVVKEELGRIRRGSYSNGEWTETESRLNELLKTLKILEKSTENLYAWNLWKKGKEFKAYEKWFEIYESPFISKPDMISAMCGIAMFKAKNKDKIGIGPTMSFVEKINEKLENLYDLNIHCTTTLNNLGIILTKMGKYKKAEEILQKAFSANRILENNKDVYKEAMHQGAKNRYNLGIIYQETKRTKEAFEFFKDAASDYEKVGAETDLAATFYRMAITGPESKRLEYLVKSAELWYLHRDDDPNRWEKAKENIIGEVDNYDLDKGRIISEIIEGIRERMDPILEERRGLK